MSVDWSKCQHTTVINGDLVQPASLHIPSPNACVFVSGQIDTHCPECTCPNCSNYPYIGIVVLIVLLIILSSLYFRK